jgi:hypothetical protein
MSMQEVKADSFFNFFAPPEVPEVRGPFVKRGVVSILWRMVDQLSPKGTMYRILLRPN